MTPAPPTKMQRRQRQSTMTRMTFIRAGYRTRQAAVLCSSYTSHRASPYPLQTLAVTARRSAAKVNSGISAVFHNLVLGKNDLSNRDGSAPVQCRRAHGARWGSPIFTKDEKLIFVSKAFCTNFGVTGTCCILYPPGLSGLLCGSPTVWNSLPTEFRGLSQFW